VFESRSDKDTVQTPMLQLNTESDLTLSVHTSLNLRQYLARSGILPRCLRPTSWVRWRFTLPLSLTLVLCLTARCNTSITSQYREEENK
jgi:hypothetical protein